MKKSPKTQARSAILLCQSKVPLHRNPPVHCSLSPSHSRLTISRLRSPNLDFSPHCWLKTQVPRWVVRVFVGVLVTALRPRMAKTSAIDTFLTLLSLGSLELEILRVYDAPAAGRVGRLLVIDSVAAG